MAKIACAVDEIRSLISDEIKTILDGDKKGEFLLLDFYMDILRLLAIHMEKRVRLYVGLVDIQLSPALKLPHLKLEQNQQH
jgi:hypothetical protein